MPFSSRLRSYLVRQVMPKIALCTFLGFLAFTGEETSASTPSLESSVTIQTFLAASPSAVSPTQTTLLPSSTARPGLPQNASSVTIQTFSMVSPSAISPSQTTLLPSSTSSPSLPQNASFQITIQLSQTVWSEELSKKASLTFVSLATNLTTAVSSVLKSVGDASVEVVEFKPGSVIAVLNVTASSSKENDMKSKLTAEMKDGKIGGFAVEPVLYSGTLFDVVLKIKFACNNSVADKGFHQKGSLENTISTLMSSNQKFTAVNTRLIECLEADNITMTTIRVQINDPSAVNPNKELSSLKSAVDAGQVGNFSLVPDWKPYVPGEKLFHLLATLETETNNTLNTTTYLDALIPEKFENESNFRFGSVDMLDNKTVAIDVGMSSSTSELPSVALDPLAGDLKYVKLGNVKLVKKYVRVTIDPKSVTKKIFEVNFARNVPSCKSDDISNTNSTQYQNLSKGIWEFIDTSMRANSRVSPFYLETKVEKMLCHNATTVRSFSYVFMKANTEDKVGQMQFLLKCKIERGIYDWGLKATLKTPTLSDTKGSWNLLQGVWIHWVCPKPKPKPTTRPPTSLPKTTGEPATSGNPLITGHPTATSTERPQNGTEPTATSEITKQPSTKATVPTPDIKPELYIKLALGMTWGEFCSKQETLKEKIAQNVRDKNGNKVSPDRIIYINVEKNCADPSKRDELAEVWFYVSQPGSKELHEFLTLKTYEMFTMFFENGNTKQLGPDFGEKVRHVELAGNDASKHKEKTQSKMPFLTIILIAVGGAVGLFLMLLACCCLFCCGRRRRRQSRKYDSERPQVLHVIHVDNGGAALAGKDKEKHTEKDNKYLEKESAGGKEKGDEDNSKGGRDNDGYEHVNDNCNNANNDNNNSNNSSENADGKDRKGDQSVPGKPNLPNDESNAYGDLKTGGVGDHTYASISKPVNSEEGSGNNSTSVTNVPIVVPPVPPAPPMGNGRGAGTDVKNAGSGSLGGNSSGTGNGRESQKGGSQSSPQPIPASLTKADADPKNQDRRGSRIQSLTDEDIPLTHKTGTVGIVALAIRNKNEMKKETEFKNLNKAVPSDEVNYPPDTANKNRFPDVLPAPRTRVKLSTQPDYINANWIRDHKGQRCYIATQHPLQETVEDFWRMVWDQQANAVVMVNEKEKEIPADFTDYLPKGEGNSRRFGAFNISVKQVTEKADYILTVLSITESKNPASSREVSHFRFISWKGRAMPNVALFVGFVTATREARKKYGDTNAPTIVHCSDGLGFTGVFIAVDIGIKSHEESKTSVVDVFELSKNLRNDRHGIVCSLEHYNFIYQALYEYTVNYDKSDK